MLLLQTILPLALLASVGVNAHPGHDITEEVAERVAFLKRSPKSVRSCAAKLKARGHEAANLQRREALAHKVRAKRGLSSTKWNRRRSVSDYEFSHNSTDSSLSADSSETDFFSNSSCLLQPEVTQGPYFVNGELIRDDVTEEESGVAFTVDIQIIDTSTCEPISDLYIDFWHCNATGVYSGVVANGNGDSSDATNINNTFLRGVQQTDENGVVQFQTIFPGHYSGRATHIHMMAHNPNYTVVASNETLLGSNDSSSVHAYHVGQLFFDQDLITAIDTVEPYASNDQGITQNSDDSILGEEANSMDPFVEYMYLGDSIEDGLMAWISIGIDTSLDSEVGVAGVHYDTGGVAVSGGMGGIGGSGGPLNGTAGPAATGGPLNGTAGPGAAGGPLNGTAGPAGPAGNGGPLNMTAIGSMTVSPPGGLVNGTAAASGPVASGPTAASSFVSSSASGSGSASASVAQYTSSSGAGRLRGIFW